MVWKAALATAGAKALGGIVGGAFQSKMSQANAREQMDFQERMSNTAYQRAASDLEAAGLNRILAIGSPASTPGGAMGQVADFGNLIGGAVDTGIAGYGTAQQVVQSKAQTDNILQQTKVLDQKEIQETQKSELWKVIGPILQDAAGNFDQLLAASQDPSVLSDLQQAAKYTTENVQNNIINLIIENTDASREDVKYWLDAAKKIGTRALSPISGAKDLFNEPLMNLD